MGAGRTQRTQGERFFLRPCPPLCLCASVPLSLCASGLSGLFGLSGPWERGAGGEMFLFSPRRRRGNLFFPYPSPLSLCASVPLPLCASVPLSLCASGLSGLFGLSGLSGPWERGAGGEMFLFSPRRRRGNLFSPALPLYPFEPPSLCAFVPLCLCPFVPLPLCASFLPLLFLSTRYNPVCFPPILVLNEPKRCSRHAHIGSDQGPHEGRDL